MSMAIDRPGPLGYGAFAPCSEAVQALLTLGEVKRCGEAARLIYLKNITQPLSISQA